MNPVLFSSNTDNWRTPSKLFDLLVREYCFEDLFPFCSTSDQLEINPKKYNNKRVFINPPYSKLRDEKYYLYISNVVKCSSCCVLLIPSRTDTKYFHYFLSHFRPYVFFLEGRLRFNESNQAPFPSIVLVFCKHNIGGNYTFGTLDNFCNWLYRYLNIMRV